ncbi:translation initiation factor IF-2 [Candidatus Roizmanbacteria bacterium]|nr:MAG: translation initiation factor IF-2 [Candidatus Roizmanbacteria bacterium]
MVRPPIVTILGHVDHGKTTLLDTIRKSRIAAKEHGGITQRIGGYEIHTGIKGYETDKITFIDTPGHEAFSKLRSRGANVADIAILIIDSTDSVMPQTIESIAHIKSAGIPYIIALNKSDLPTANPKRVQRDLLKHEVITEEMGGDIVALPISAKSGDGVPELLESILLIASDLKLAYKKENPASAYIVETKKDQRGVVVSAIIKDGMLKVGDDVYTNQGKVRVRSLINDLGKTLREVEPSTPFELLGFSEMPEVGTFITSEEQKIKEQEKQATGPQRADFDAFLSGEAPTKKLSVVLKADSQGSLEAITNALSKNENIEVRLNAVGDIHRSDIFLAKTTKSIVIGFSVHSDNEVKELARQEKVIIKTYNIIYELLEELEEVSALLMEKEQQEKNLKAQAKVLATFIIEGETIFGSLITKGKVNIGDPAEIYRGDNLIGKSRLISLKIRAKSVQEVKKDQECGMQFSPALDIKVGDMIKFIL